MTPSLGAGFDRVFAAVDGLRDGPIAIGVSGGSDSLALLFLASEWARKNQCSLVIFTVDHQLRPEAADEAAYVKRLSHALGHRHATLVWRQPKSGQKAARLARFELLCQAMQAEGARLLLLGHTLDDVLETALMRRKRGRRGWAAAGPGALTPAPVWPHGRKIAIVRPLLQQSRAGLQAYLKDRQVKWFADPSNENRKYERARLRMQLRQHPLWLQRLSPFLLRLLADRSAADSALADALRQRLTVYKSGLLLLDTPTPEKRLLSCAIRYAGGHDMPPRFEAMERLLNADLAPGERRVLGGAWLQRTAQGFLIGRDPAVWQDAPKFGLWDGRYEPAADEDFPIGKAQPFLLRTTAPQTPAWREVLSERIAFEASCFAAHQHVYAEPMSSPLAVKSI